MAIDSSIFIKNKDAIFTGLPNRIPSSQHEQWFLQELPEPVPEPGTHAMLHEHEPGEHVQDADPADPVPAGETVRHQPFAHANTS